MLYTPLTQLAMTLCYQAHRDQTDKGGVPYVFHPFHLAETMDTEEAICTALLHDAVGDGGLTLAHLRRAGLPETVVRAVDALTRRPGQDYETYLIALARNPLARRVKWADLAHNSHPGRLAALPAPVRARLEEKYRNAQALLAAEEGSAPPSACPAQLTQGPEEDYDRKEVP